MLSYVSLNSKDSLEEFLNLYQCRDDEKRKVYKKEREIIHYLQNLGLKMKTDPLLKLKQRYKGQENLQFIYKGDISPVSEGKVEKTNFEIQAEHQFEDGEFLLENNPLMKRGSRKLIRSYSFENKDQINPN